MKALPAMQFATHFSPARGLSVTTVEAYVGTVTAQGISPTHKPFAHAGSIIPTLSRPAADHVPSMIGGQSCGIASGAAQHSRKIGSLFGDCKRRSISFGRSRRQRTVAIQALQMKHYLLANGAAVNLDKGKDPGEQFSLPWTKDYAFSLDCVEVSLDAASQIHFRKRDRTGANRHAEAHSMTRAALNAAGDRASAERDGASRA